MKSAFAKNARFPWLFPRAAILDHHQAQSASHDAMRQSPAPHGVQVTDYSEVKFRDERDVIG
ncbi:MAG: hypothetical protein ABJH26_12000, partial [Marinomonas sp.]